jgi:hypothetical protein
MSDTIRFQFSVRSDRKSNDELLDLVKLIIRNEFEYENVSDIQAWVAGTQEDFERK